MSIVPAGTEVSYTVTWLEMTSRPSFPRPHLPAGSPSALLKADEPPVWFFLGLYGAVGRDYAWEDMFARPEEELEAWLHDPNTSLYTLMKHGWPHGFVMLDHRTPGVCEIAYFGLVPQAVGRGLGRFLLESAIHMGWELPGVEKMTVNTCTLDHPRALGTYQKCGFSPVRRQEFTRVLTRPIDPSRIPS